MAINAKMIYGDAQRFLLRTIASRGVISVSQAETIFRQHYPDQGNTHIADLVKEINDKIRPFQQTIKIVIDEMTAESIVVFLSLGFDATTKSQNMFSVQELDFFRLLIEQIMTTENRQISSQHALNLVNNIKLSKSDADKLLKMWCRMHYLEKIDSNYALGIRGIHEFQNYLRENLPDTIQECCLCRNIVFRGYNCPVCAKAIHSRCLNTYLDKVQKWPCCKVDFNQTQLERLDNTGLTQTQPQTKEVTQNCSSSIHEEVISDDDFEQSLLTPIPGISQRLGRKRKRKTRN